MRNYELMVILDPSLDERTISPSLDAFLRVVRGDGGTVEKVDVWGKRRMSYEIAKHAEGIYAVLDVVCEPATVAELDRQLSLNESVLRTKVMRVQERGRQATARATAARAAAPGGPSSVAAASAGSRSGTPESTGAGESSATPASAGPSTPASTPASTSAPTPASTPASTSGDAPTPAAPDSSAPTPAG